jgi:hypothetical protein
LPWSTANEHLVKLFKTTGQVELAKILFGHTHSKGCGVDVCFNDHWHTFTQTAAKGSQVAPIQADMV